jgi:N-acetylmuramoyl-L-alanine amidase
MRQVLTLIALILSLAGCVRHHVPYITTSPVPLQRTSSIRPQATIAIDAGHGGQDLGTTGATYQEKRLALATSIWVRDQLQRLGYRVILTRPRDAFVALPTRAQIANEAHADVFVSIHYNSSPNPSAHGIEVFYYEPPNSPNSRRTILSKQLAQDALKSITATTHAASRGVKEASFAVLRNTQMPAILIEGGFLTNESERQRLLNPTYLESMALSIAHGIDQFVQQQAAARGHS